MTDLSSARIHQGVCKSISRPFISASPLIAVSREETAMSIERDESFSSNVLRTLSKATKVSVDVWKRALDRDAYLAYIGPLRRS